MEEPAEAMTMFLFLFGFLGGFIFGVCYLLWEAFRDS